MTKPDDAEKSEEEFEVLPSAKSLDLPLGIRCMEVNVQEVDDAVRQFTKMANDITSPSWKFPHVTLDKLDVTHVMNVFRGHKTLSDNQLYMELMELLIDRLYYAIMTSYEFVNGLEAAFFNAGLELESSTSRKDSAIKKRDWDPLEIAKKSLEDNTPKPFHTANIGMLVRQFCVKMMLLENIVLNNIHCFKKSKPGLNGDDPPRSRDAYYLPIRHSETQTEASLEEGCDSCFIAQNILKCVADEVDSTLRTFNESDSQISKTRLELRKDAFSITQRGALMRWLQALGTDCTNISNCANMLLDINVKSQEDIRALKEDLEIKEERHHKESTEMQQTITELQEELKCERDCRSKISKLKDTSTTKLNDAEKTLELKTKECERLQRECEALQRSFNIAEELNLQIKSNLARCSGELEKVKKEFDGANKEREILSKQVRNLSAELAKVGQEVLKLNECSEMARHYDQENKRLQHEVTKMRKLVDKFETRDGDAKKMLDERESKIASLTEELKSTTSKIEVLTLYPDLNGPLNAHMKKSGSGGSSCIETMEMQVKSNQIRMEILRAQSERLTMTVSKLRAHMNHKNRAEMQQGKGSGSRASLASGGSS